MEEAADKFGGVIDMIVLNAGISMGVPFEVPLLLHSILFIIYLFIGVFVYL